MNCRLLFVLLVVAVATVKGSPGAGEAIWAKHAKKTLVTTPVKAPVQQPTVQQVEPQARSVPAESARQEPVVEPEDAPAEKEEKPSVFVKNVPTKRDIPLFAKMILGDPEHPKLAKVEDLRKVDLRSSSHSLELPNKHTIPITKELFQKTAELLRLFQEIQQESNGFVEDVENHNANEASEYIGYYN